ncbi:autotransporter outer membrane beta-barrel domain-containing protein [Sphingopyxis sp.]|uniref:autotransporter outer membrane beta-barrel domain-containing protein n=1 Tax=Sphingopyxis sp. TaxID=1908224 RepID=UPI002D77FE7A|nr:autotransporter outer membrane beta-barrel domain-containing protein [Sphingopyxis sp.]HET6526816.1 autotransporter outer membrane beta-barrel domain-containing protein [Sphingopyxis sp.]
MGLVSGVPVASAQSVTTSGDVNPSPATSPDWDVGGVLNVGDAGIGSLTVAGGGTVTSTFGQIGVDSGGTGTVTVTGTGSNWTSSSSVYVGMFGSGTLNIANRGSVDVDTNSTLGEYGDSSGIATVSGPGSRWTTDNLLYVGAAGNGTLGVENGGSVFAADAIVGEDAGSVGLVTVAGTGSSVSLDSNLVVGQAGTGTLEIAGGGAVTTGNQGILGFFAGSEGVVTVTGPDSVWNLSNSLQVGREGSGELTISNGGVVSTAAAHISVDFRTIGSRQGASGEVTVTGAGSAWLGDANLTVGGEGTGTLTIAAGGLATSGTAVIGSSVDAVGTATVTGGNSAWTNSDQMLVGFSGKGALTISNGGSVSNAITSIGEAAGSTGAVSVTGANSILANSADLFVGNAGSGTLTVTGGGSAAATQIMIAALAGSTGILNIGSDAGQAATAAGTLGASEIAFGAGAGSMIFNHTDADYDFDVAITGAGTIQQVAGVTRLTADNSGFTGSIAISGGTLLVDGTLGDAASEVVVLGGGTLGGTGTIGGDVTVGGGATLAPGNSPGTLTVGGDLELTPNAVLAFEFGQAGIVGGALNDLVDVGGNLTLDGTINVSASAGGSFGPGIYRIFNYGGALTDDGLALGTIPGGTAGVSVQTAVAGQVNLVNAAGRTLGFWDGNAGPKNDGIVNGGNGVWRVGGGSSSWADADGALNADYTQDSLAIFSGARGTVTIDDIGGNVQASGLQFASNGYSITGDSLTLTGTRATVQVGDGSAASTAYTAIIASELTGSAQLVKTDAGRLILTGSNSYTGGTAIDGGTLQIGNGGATGSIIGDIDNDGALVVNRSGTLSLGGTISGSGSLAKSGSGTLVLTGTNSYRGGTTVSGGTVQISSDANLGDAAGRLSLQGATLQAGASFTSARDILVGSPTANRIDTQGFDVTLTGTIGNGANNPASNILEKTGSGTLTLTGDNIYVNRTAISGGTLALAGAGRAGVGNFIVGAGTVLDISQTDTGARVIQLGSGPAGTIALGSRMLTLGLENMFSDWSGTITDGGIAGGTGGSVVIAGLGGGVRYLEANSYTGGTTLLSGRFELVGNGSLHSGGAVTVHGGVFDISGITGSGTTIGDLSGSGGGAGTIVLGDKTLTFGADNDSYFTGTIAGAGGALVKNGAGAFTLTGANSYTGTTSVNAGTLLVNGDQSAATGLTSVAAGATLGGSGTIGGDVFVADGGTLAPGNSPGTLTINGGLTLSGGSTLAYEFGARNAVGNPLNDLVDVAGNLTLDGTINVSVAAGGTFDVGLYRVANYGGTLTDNSLAIGTMPASADAFVQTSVAGQVNLINTGGALLNFWDGSAGANKFNNVVDGGSGMWRTGLDNSWTEATGAANAGYASGAFAIFAGTGGVVTIDNSLGAVSASGMQFAAANYRVQGGALTLTGPQSVIRVGDGGSAGLGYNTIITAEITGNSQLVKTDLGRLELTGTNSYTGGTAFNGGAVQISSDANLGAASGGLSFNGGTLATTTDISSGRTVDLAGQGVFSIDADTTLTLTGNLTGAGLIGKLGAGTLLLAGAGSHSGGIEVVQGTLLVNGDYGAATGPVTVNQLTTLGGTGTIGGDINLSGTLAPGAGGAGTLTVGGDLFIRPTATLDFEFGEAGVVGGALNDLVNVGGDLVLDGVLNVGVPVGGAFDVGIYRMFNYGGTLTDNGVTLGTMPAESNAVVQTSIAGQVNLVNSGVLALNFWDGAAGPKNEGVINGGNGSWQASGGDDNWTGENGAVNAGYTDGAFAIFGGTGGTVTVDDGLGAVAAVGMQFAANDYVIAGDGITLTDPTATIRVGDGSAAGADFTATINSALGGAAQLIKTDAGTLVLGGTNSYTGGTQIVGGTLRISSDANLGAASGEVTFDGGTLETIASLTSARDIEIASAGTITPAADTRFTYDGLISGTGSLTKGGAGTLLVTADSSGFGGSTSVAAGTLVVQGGLGGAVSVGAAGRLEGTGRVGSLANAGVVAPGTSIGSLTVAGDYTGNGGVLEIEAELGGDSSLADRLIVGGATSGNTRVTVTNRGGLGAQTVEGIKIVDVAGASNGSFVLDGDYLFDGEQAVIAGAYGYRLYKNGVATPQDGDWYLRSALLASENPQGPLYQPGVPVYEAYVGALQSLNRLPTLQQRVGNRSWAASPIAGAGLWGRFESERQRPEALVSTSDADRKVDQWQAQIGLDAVVAERSDGAALVGGLTAHYGKADSSVASIFGNGTIDTQGYGIGATMTWYGPKGFYVDGQVKLSWFDSDLESSILGSLTRGNKGDGQAFSLEVGKQTSIGGNLSITPQVQMSYAKVDFDRFADPSDAAVSVAKGESLKTRGGLAIDHQTSWKGAAGDTRRTRLYTVVNLSYEWLDGAEADVSGTPIANRDHRLTGELGLGGSYSWGDDRFTLYTEVSGDTAIADFGAGYNLKGTAGFRVRF